MNRKRISSTVSHLLNEQGMLGTVEVSVAIVGDRKMRSLNKKYRNIDKTTNVLSFSLTEGEAVALGGDILRLGDIVLSYPEVIRQAAKEDMLVDDKIDELLKHAVMHLLGLHHDA